MPSDGGPRPVAVCGGSDCAKDERAAHRALVASLLTTGATVTRTKCLGMCHGPVAIVDPLGRHGTPVVVEKLRKPKHRDRLASIVGGADPDGWKRVVTGKPARKALRKARASVR